MESRTDYPFHKQISCFFLYKEVVTLFCIDTHYCYTPTLVVRQMVNCTISQKWVKLYD